MEINSSFASTSALCRSEVCTLKPLIALRFRRFAAVRCALKSTYTLDKCLRSQTKKLANLSNNPENGVVEANQLQYVPEGG